MSKLEFDDELSRAVEQFNASPGATRRRAAILAALEVEPGQRVLDVGSGPGNQAFEIASAVGPGGRVDGVDVAESAIEIARQRCSTLGNVAFHLGQAAKLPFNDASFDVAMSSQVFEYLDDVPSALAELHRVLKPGGRALIHDTDWGAVVWHSTDPERMARVMTTWDSHRPNRAELRPEQCERRPLAVRRGLRGVPRAAASRGRCLDRGPGGRGIQR